MKTYYVHQPSERKQVTVAFVGKSGRKQTVHTAFIIDLPGSPYCEDGEFNCHVDGCDYYRDNFEECMKLGMEIYNYSNEEYKIKNVPFSSDKYKYDLEQWSKELIKY